MLGAAWIADRAVLPALQGAGNARAVAIASRSPERARTMAERHGVERVHDSYEALLADPEVEAVYLPLVNSLHREWTLKALAAGKHVLCEKPLALTVTEAEAMAAGARVAGRLLMEALMYRFHPRLARQVTDIGRKPIRHVSSWFGFRAADPANYRLRPELGGGALLDVGCYCLSFARWLLGEPDEVAAVARTLDSGVDVTFGAALRFPTGQTAFAWGSFESPEYQAAEVVFEDRTLRIEEPFTAWKNPDDPYQLMLEAFSAAALTGAEAPLPLEESIANLRVIERVREAAGLRSY
ncbi:MAG TPA: Gfo/Idh/MocA family oxidoreductase [Candidatus Dormibacteraeota bacterium]